LKPVYVKWIDHAGLEDFVPLSVAKTVQLLENETLGFLISEDEEKIVLAGTYSRKQDLLEDHDRVSSVQVLAKKMIVEIKEIKI